MYTVTIQYYISLINKNISDKKKNHIFLETRRFNVSRGVVMFLGQELTEY